MIKRVLSTRKPSLNLKNSNKQVALVTGGTRGAGYEIVEKLLQLNIPTLFTGRNIKELDIIEKSFSKHGHTIKGLPLDLLCSDSVSNFKEYIDYYKPNILINNAGMLSLKKTETNKKQEKLFKVNTVGPMILTEYCLPHMLKSNESHIMFNSPPINIDKKMNFIRPYMQTKIAQTFYMKTMASILENKNISVNSFWTNYPLWTDALKKRNIGKIDNCVDPAILATVVECILQENPLTFKGNEIIDESFLINNNIDVKAYALGHQTKYLDQLFLEHLR
jgi:citronellol/citronellal dehydrogenase